METAIIGISCRFPGAGNYNEFWENLIRNKSGITEIPADRWDWQAYWGDPNSGKNKSLSKWGGFIDAVDAFDMTFFGLTPKVVQTMDPQQRIMLEMTWACFEDAAIPPSTLKETKVGVFLGVFNHDYKELQESIDISIEAHHSTGTATAVIPNRVSHYFSLKGPSIPIDTACSSSLNAIHSAIQAIDYGDCEMALAGGINLLLTPTRHISFSKMGMLSPTGSCKTFDDSADGYVRGEGAGVVLLKPLAKALADGDSIYGVVKGSAVNHGGRTYTLTYPNPDAQAEVIVAAIERAGIPVQSLSYIEAHGTGTPKGDPIEFNGLMTAFGKLAPEADKESAWCGLGSVKTNIGHLEAAAGVAGVIKVLLSLKHCQLPPLHNYKALNARITMDGTPFYIVDRLQPWLSRYGHNPLRAGISSFGFGGTNAHVVIEQAPEIEFPEIAQRPCHLICLSARTEAALAHKRRDLLTWLEKNKLTADLPNISATLLLGRDHFDFREAYVVKDIDELMKMLIAIEAEETAGTLKPTALPQFGNTSSSDTHARDNYYRSEQLTEESKTEPEEHEYRHQLARETFEKLRLYKHDCHDSKQDSHDSKQDSHDSKQDSHNSNHDSHTYVEHTRTLAELYILRDDLDWQQLFPHGFQRLHLPTYPFTQQRCWLTQTTKVTKVAHTEQIKPQTQPTQAPVDVTQLRGKIHPLLHRNISTIDEQLFCSEFTRSEDFIPNIAANSDLTGSTTPHCQFPETTALEMVREAVAQATDSLGRKKGNIYLKNITWAQPIDIPATVYVGIYPHNEVWTEKSAKENGALTFELFTRPAADQRLIHCRGYASVNDRAAIPPLDLSALQQIFHQDSATPTTCSAEECYQILSSLGLHFTPPRQLIKTLYFNAEPNTEPNAENNTHYNHGRKLTPKQPPEQCLVKLSLPPELIKPLYQGTTPPLIADACMQAARVLIAKSDPQALVPGALQIFNPCPDGASGEFPATLWAWIRINQTGNGQSNHKYLDIDLFDDHLHDGKGKVRFQLEGLVLQPPETRTPVTTNRKTPGKANTATDCLLFYPQWCERPAAENAPAPVYSRHIALLLEFNPDIKTALDRKLPGVECLLVNSEQNAIENAFETQTIVVIETVKNIIRQHIKDAKNDPVLLQLVIPADGEQRLLFGLSGILKTARKEYPKFIGQLIGVEAGASADALAEKLRKSSRCPQDQEIEYRHGKRLVSTWAEWKSAGRAQREATSPWRKNGVYLITGDAGGPGLMYAKIYAKELARNASHPTIFLTGRREITSADSAALKALQPLGATVEYRQVDISDLAAVRALITSIQETGQLKGVIHCADVQRDNIILKKPTDEIAPVLAPKVRGLINLDTATRDIDLDFFVLFASTAGALGNTGQADYAAANAFMDAYAAHRDQQVKSRQRSGRTLSINWPLWAWDDTQANATTEKKLQQEMGAVLLTLEAGIWAFYQSLCTDQPAPCFQVLVMEGEPEKIRSSLLPMTDTGATGSESAPSPYDLLNPSGPEASSTAVSAQR